jgi:hypothetical protein
MSITNNCYSYINYLMRVFAGKRGEVVKSKKPLIHKYERLFK